MCATQDAVRNVVYRKLSRLPGKLREPRARVLHVAHPDLAYVRHAVRCDEEQGPVAGKAERGLG